MDAELRAEVDDALRDTGRYGPGFEVVRQEVSGSRQNYLLRVDDAASERRAVVWCRATHEAIDDAFAGRFTLAREAGVLRRLATLPVRVPRLLGSSSSGRAHIQAFIDEREPADAMERERGIAGFFAELDRLYLLDVFSVLPPEELAALSSPTVAVRAEVDAWSRLAEQLLLSRRLVAVQVQAVVPDATRRVERVLSQLTTTRIPDVGPNFDLVHGDAGRANYIVDRSGEAWIIDFELAHAGSRLEDFAWCELRGLEQDEAVWRRNIMARLDLMTGGSVEAYRYFRMLIYFRSVVAIAARIAADPTHAFATYLAQRLVENETLGWLAAAALPDAERYPGSMAVSDPSTSFTPASMIRLHAWQNWTQAIDEVQAQRQR